MRYLPLTAADRRAMLAEDRRRRHRRPVRRHARGQAAATSLVDLPEAQGEMEVERALGASRRRTRPRARCRSSSAPGPTSHHVPATVDHLIQRSEFLTSYTPYQPEIAQGTLQYLFEFQTQVAMLTGMEVANASMYDGSTAASEAVLMAQRVTRRNKAVLSRRICIRTTARPSRRSRAWRRARDRGAAAARRRGGPRRQDRRQTARASSCRTPTSSGRCAT